MKPATKKTEKTAKQKLAEGAAKIRREKAAEKAASKAASKPAKGSKPAKAPKAPKAKKNAVVVNVEVLPPIEPSKHPVESILKKYIKIAADNGSLTVDESIPASDYVVAFDHINALRENSQFLLGDLINQGEGLKCFGGKYAAAMASTGRPISTLKGYAYVARQIPPDLRGLNPALTYSHCKEVAAVPKLEDKRTILTDAAKSAEKGEVLTVPEIRKKAEKFKKKKPAKAKKPDKHTAKPDLDMSAAEREIYDELEDTASKLDRQIEGASFVLEMSPKQTATLREKLERVARFFTQIS